MKSFGRDKKLDGLVKKYPSNLAICTKILEKLENTHTIVEENKEFKSSLYIAITDKIIIADIKESYTRIQTIAHECIHSIQDRKILLFNFIFSNIFLIYYICISILTICNILPFKMLFTCILIFMGMIYMLVRNYLENDAMIKAKFLAKEYMEEEEVSTKEDIKLIIDKYEYINNIGIKLTNYNIFLGVILKVIIYVVLVFVTNYIF